MRGNKSEYRIVSAELMDRQSWQSYVDKHEDGTVFHTPYIYEVYNATPNFQSYALFCLNSGGKIEAMLAGFLQTVKPGILSSISTRSVMLQGPIHNGIESLKQLLDYYKKWISGKAVYTEIRNHFVDVEYSKCLQDSNFKWEGHYNIIREIPHSTDQLWKEIGRKRKDGINKAKRFNFIVSEDNSQSTINDFYEMLTKNYSQLHLPIPKRVFFENCLTKDTSGYCKLFKLEDSDTTKIVLLAFLHNGLLHAVYIGDNKEQEFISKRPVDFFYFEVMRWCVENGVKFFDWLGAGKPNVSYGVRDFKLQYGGELVDYGRFNLVHSPLKYKIAERGFRLLQKMKRKI